MTNKELYDRAVVCLKTGYGLGALFEALRPLSPRRRVVLEKAILEHITEGMWIERELSSLQGPTNAHELEIKRLWVNIEGAFKSGAESFPRCPVCFSSLMDRIGIVPLWVVLADGSEDSLRLARTPASDSAGTTRVSCPNGHTPIDFLTAIGAPVPDRIREKYRKS